MDALHFAFTVSVPRDESFVETVRLLAVQAARYAGHADEACEAFGATVGRAVRARAQTARSAGVVSVVVRRAAGPVEVLVDGDALTLES